MGKWRDVCQTVQTQLYTKIKSRTPVYSLVTIVNDTVVNTGNMLSKFQVFSWHIQKVVTMWGNGRLITLTVVIILLCVCVSNHIYLQFSSVTVVSDSLWPHESQHARPPCPSPTPRVYSNSCPSSRWCHTAISSSVVPFSSCPQSLPTSGSFFFHLFLLVGG